MTNEFHSETIYESIKCPNCDAEGIHILPFDKDGLKITSYCESCSSIFVTNIER